MYILADYTFPYLARNFGRAVTLGHSQHVSIVYITIPSADEREPPFVR